MDCPNCGVYNPDERTVCWRCDKELPKPKQEKKRGRDTASFLRRTWLIVGLAIVIWLVLTWLLPLLFNTPATPVP